MSLLEAHSDDLLAPPGAPLIPARLPRAFRLSAWFALFRVSVQQLIRGKRLLALAGLYMLPLVLVALPRYLNPNYLRDRAEVEEIVVFYMIPQALIPLTALILSSGMVRDEVEGQTLTYLLIRPIPRPAIYLAKLLAAWVVASLLAAVFLTITMTAIHYGADGFWGEYMPGRTLKVVALSTLSLLAYTSLFGGMSLIVRWVLPFGVAYVVLFEGVFANIDFMIRRLTVLWYVRVLAERWLGLHVDTWTIHLDDAPGGPEALGTLMVASLVLALAAAWHFGSREIRVKTPEGG